MKATGDLGTSARCAKIIETWEEEVAMPPLFFVMDELAKKTKLSPPKLSDFVEFLDSRGAKASRTHFDPKGLKTDLGAKQLVREYKAFAKKN
jgi:tRNA (guanine26-N2/guanine27-N2)-dimethyltransferase